MIYLSCQPAIDRYTWEVEVYLENFLKMGVPPQQIHLVNGLDREWKEIPSSWRKLQKKYSSVNFWFYYDTRPLDNNYPPSLQAHLLEKHWIHNPQLEKETIFFHDADFILTRPFDFTPFLQDEHWYLSNTISYIGAEYIRSKGEEVLDKMCSIAGIDKRFVVYNQGGSGGAQKLIKKVGAKYWKDVYDLSMRFWREVPVVSERIKKAKESKGEPYHELQHWTMSMWAELWTGWKLGKSTRVVKEFNFMFATNPIGDWDTYPFFHNAGVMGNDRDKLFYKGDYDSKLPYKLGLLNADETKASFRYYQWIKEVGVTSCL
tara:strand:+ start:3618 stop:4568 length:951 start_codon:yes stop_codon:yes gene_type:complete